MWVAPLHSILGQRQALFLFARALFLCAHLSISCLSKRLTSVLIGSCFRTLCWAPLPVTGFLILLMKIPFTRTSSRNNPCSTDFNFKNRCNSNILQSVWRCNSVTSTISVLYVKRTRFDSWWQCIISEIKKSTISTSTKNQKRILLVTQQWVLNPSQTHSTAILWLRMEYKTIVDRPANSETLRQTYSRLEWPNTFLSEHKKKLFYILYY